MVESSPTRIWPRASVEASGGAVSPQDLIKQAEEHWNVSGSSVLAAWALTALGAILIFSLYSWRREKDELIYLPRIAASEKRVKEWEAKGGSKEGINPPKVPPRVSGFFAWLTPQFKDFWLEFWQPLRRKGIEERDVELLELLGLDAVTYLQFLRLLRWLFLTISVLAAIPLTIANYYINTKTTYGSADAGSDSASGGGGTNGSQVISKSLLDNMVLLTAANITSNGLWVHIGFEWIVTCFVLAFVIAHSWYHETLVRKWVEMNQNEISFKSLMVTNIMIQPRQKLKGKNHRKGTREVTVAEAKIQICTKLNIPHRPYSYKDPQTGKIIEADCTVVLTHKNMAKLAHMMEEFKGIFFPEFERCLTAFMRRYKNHFGGGEEYDSCWSRIKGQAKSVETRADEKCRELERRKFAIEKEQARARGDPSLEDILPIGETVASAFVTFATARKAHQVLRDYRKRPRRKFGEQPHVERAPRSKNIVWKNLEQDASIRHSHAIAGRLATVVIFFLNTIPLLLVTVLANLNYVIDKVDYLHNLQDSSPIWKGLFAVVGGILPPAVAALCGYILPYVVRFFDRWSGALTRGALDKAVIKQMFIFLLVSNFIMFSLLGVLYEAYLSVSQDIGNKPWKEIYNNLGDLPVKITTAYISESSYWLSWFPLRAALVCLELLQLPRIFLKLWQSITVRTATDLHELAKPVSFEYAIEYIQVLFAMVVALVYTPLAPIVVICGTIYFWTVSIVHYNQLKYVEDTKETDGKVWDVVRNRLLTATVIMQLLMTLTIGLKTKSPTMTITAFVPIIFVLTLKHLERSTSIFSKTTALIASKAADTWWNTQIPEFEHELLKRDWMPEFHWVKEDRTEFDEAQEKFPSLRKLLGREEDDDDEPKLDEKRKKKKGKSESKRHK